MVFGPYIGLKLANVNAYNISFVICMLISAVTVVLAMFIRVPQEAEESGPSTDAEKVVL